MKIYPVGLGLTALAVATTAQIPSNEYLPPSDDLSIVSTGLESYPEIDSSALLADDGYRYKTVRRLRHRRRRDVNELASNEYLPPVEDLSVAAPAPEYLAPVQEAEPAAVLADDGYRYKTVRRLRHRRRRDVNELASNEYLPPVEDLSVAAPAPEYLAPVQEAEPAAVLADDGYRYKTVRRLRHRRRRDVNELASNEYLPPVEDLSVAAPAPEYLAPVQEAEPAAVLADDGYRYKTVRRLRHRRRRDVNELASNEYLPPVEDLSVAAPAPEYLAPVQEAEPAAVLADDGYRYKTVRRLRLRRRRDVNELASNEYLPPVEDLSVAAPAPEYLAPVQEAEPAAVLADDGYRYKTVRRLRLRRRRDVNELASNEYLPPVEDLSVAAPAPEYLAPVQEAEPAAVLADDGYRYKTVRRLRHRRRRDVNELASNEYLPPVEDLSVAAPAPEYLAPVQEAEPAAVLADDGYRYKTVRRLRLRRRRDVNELASNEYLPPVEDLSVAAPAPEYLAPVQEAEPAAVLADDGYRYKTVRKYKIRRH